MILTRPRRLLVVTAAGLAAVTTLAACAGVPQTSRPQVEGTLPLHQPAPSDIVTPPPGTFPRTIVQDFLNYNGSSDPHHSAARQYLAPDQRNRWSDSSSTLVYDSVTVGNNFNAKNDTVRVTGHELGSINASGEYTPTRQGDGTGGQAPLLPQTIKLRKVDGQWRISNIPYGGLLIDESQFRQYYAPRTVYYYDQSETQLVPDLRYSPLTKPSSLATWLVTALATLPSDSALTTNLPSVPNPSAVKVTLRPPVLSVELPGSNQLDSEIKNRMAAQIGLTLGPALPGDTIRITDGGRPVIIPHLGKATFDAGSFSSKLPAATGSAQLYYIQRGGLYDQSGKPVAGAIGAGRYGLTSVALARAPGTPELRVAATSGSSTHTHLLLGHTSGSLHRARRSGALSRPDWAPGHAEVWIGDGAKLYDVSASGKTSKVSITVSGGGSVSGKIKAVRLSPEGYRIALVITASEGKRSTHGQIWIGAIVRGPDSVQVNDLHPISPTGVTVTDVDWADERGLYAIGADASSGDPSVYQVNADGSFWTADGIGALPYAPDSIAVPNGGTPAVSANGTVWTLDDGSWVSPESGVTYGTNPVWVP